MLRRIALFLAVAALVPFTGGSASASCLDDLLARNPQSSDAPWQPSPYYGTGYVHQGPGTVVVESAALVYDVGNLQRYETGRVTYNATSVTSFVDCVAGLPGS